jgi:hypothetical protein
LTGNFLAVLVQLTHEKSWPVHLLVFLVRTIGLAWAPCIRYKILMHIDTHERVRFL